jgi:hypothetical protein
VSADSSPMRMRALVVAALWASCTVADTDGGAAEQTLPRAVDRGEEGTAAAKPMGVLFVGLVKDSERDLPKRFDELKT